VFVQIVNRLRAAGCVFAEEEAELLLAEADTPQRLEAMVARREGGVPLEQILGWAEFCGLRIMVEPGVFVPRRRTGFLVQQAARLLAPGDLVVDLCCGSGAVGVALVERVPGLDLYACDVDPAAVRCATGNVGDRGQVRLGDLYAALPDTLRGHVQVLAVNAPYVPSDAIRLMPPEARDYEPRVALDGGPDGVDVQRRVAAEAPEWLRPGGALLIETGADQASATTAASTRAGLTTTVLTSEELDATLVIGRRPA
jgi:release factor glutamine methyltransferase